jgi:hypothetical protein
MQPRASSHFGRPGARTARTGSPGASSRSGTTAVGTTVRGRRVAWRSITETATRNAAQGVAATIWPQAVGWARSASWSAPACFPVSPGEPARPVRPSYGPRRPAARDRACSPGPGAWRARARRPARAAATPPSRCASSTAVGATLTSRAELALDGAGPGRQASPPCLPVPTRAGTREGSNAVPTAAVWDPLPPALAAAAVRVPDRPWCAPAARRLP